MKIDLNIEITTPAGEAIPNIGPDGNVSGTVKIASIVADQLWNADEKSAERAIKLVRFSESLVSTGVIECDEVDLRLVQSVMDKAPLKAGVRVQINRALLPPQN